MGRYAEHSAHMTVFVNYRFWKYVRRITKTQAKRNVRIMPRLHKRVFVIQTKAPVSERIAVRPGMRSVQRGVLC